MPCVALGRLPFLPLRGADQPVEPNQATDAVLVDGVPVVAEFCVHPRPTVAGAAEGMDPSNHTCRTSLGCEQAEALLKLGIVAAVGETQHAAHRPHRKGGLGLPHAGGPPSGMPIPKAC